MINDSEAAGKKPNLDRTKEINCCEFGVDHLQCCKVNEDNTKSSVIIIFHAFHVLVHCIIILFFSVLHWFWIETMRKDKSRH